MNFQNLNFQYIQLKDYSNINNIRNQFPSCKNLNAYIDMETISKHTKFYIIRSNNDEDIHKVIPPST